MWFLFAVFLASAVSGAWIGCSEPVVDETSWLEGLPEGELCGSESDFAAAFLRVVVFVGLFFEELCFAATFFELFLAERFFRERIEG